MEGLKVRTERVWVGASHILGRSGGSGYHTDNISLCSFPIHYIFFIYIKTSLKFDKILVKNISGLFLQNWGKYEIFI